MPKGKKFGGRDFVKGDPRCGRKPLTDLEKEVRNTTREMVAQYWLEVSQLTSQDELIKILQDKKSPMFKKSLAAAYIKMIRTGDMTELHRYLDRLLGKSAQRLIVDDPASMTGISIIRASEALNDE